MLKELILYSAVFVFGYWFFYAVSLHKGMVAGYGHDFLGKKYLGYDSYEEMRSGVIRSNMMWILIIFSVDVVIVVSLGWKDSIWAIVFSLGYALALRGFIRKPKKSWEDERLPGTRQ